MQMRLKQAILAAAIVPALALPAAYGQSQRQERHPELGKWDVSRLYRDGWSAEEMIGKPVRGREGEEIGEVKDIIVGSNGNIERIVVEVGGFLEIGDQHIGVPWNRISIGEDMAFVQVPLREVEDGTYSLFGRVPQGEEVAVPEGAWRVNELIGDYASLRDVPRYGIVVDVVFNSRGQAQGLVVDPAAGYGVAGAYAYPYGGYYPGAYAYPLPYDRGEVAALDRFDYVRLGRESRYAGTDSGKAAVGGTSGGQRR